MSQTISIGGCQVDLGAVIMDAEIELAESELGDGGVVLTRTKISLVSDRIELRDLRCAAADGRAVTVRRALVRIKVEGDCLPVLVGDQVQLFRSEEPADAPAVRGPAQ